ncbi:MAG: HEAT repeat domain-containing protein [Deltaproteobacteria bacterium]|nr:HEAT repeat domain-containing protein [Deltaproteobacteria bacterium]MBW2017235.1 HEAT repeat domain-containing protein [Deltaproteobacteria bacterium]MBW2304428.1 HEAT repeat domain-containing protein [Deltaproteobacteria bacterium]
MGPTFTELLKDLRSEEESDRRYAVEDLGDLGDPAAIPVLVKALEDEAVAVREAAADSLIAIGGKEVCEQVLPLLSSDDARIRNYATEILEQVGAEAVEGLIRLLGDSSPDVRKFSLDVLGKIGELSEIRAIKDIGSLLDDENVNVASAAAEALGRIGDPSAVPVLVKHLSGEPWLQCNILSALSQIGGEEVRKVFLGIDPERLAPEARYYYDMAKHMFDTDRV